MCKHYQGPSSQKKYLLANMIRKVFTSQMNLANERNKILNFFGDPILGKIDNNQKLYLNKMTYFDNLVIHFDKIMT